MSVEHPAQVPVGPRSSIADLDEVLGNLLRGELDAAGVGPVAITFEAPERDRAAGWPSPSLNLFLYDIRESILMRDRSWQAAGEGSEAMRRAPLRLDCSYAITAWTRAIVDEHRLLSQALAILLAYPQIPVELLTADLLVGAPPVGLPTRVGHGKQEGRAEFWTAIGSPFKVCLEFEVSMFVESAQRRSRGPAVERAAIALEGPGTEHGLTQGGTLRRRDGSPLVGAELVVAREGVAAVVDDSGRFLLVGLPPGTYTAQVKAVDGSITAVELTVPAPMIHLVL